jgi:ribosomal protein S18 acetylase RimI-like enzyme
MGVYPQDKTETYPLKRVILAHVENAALRVPDDHEVELESVSVGAAFAGLGFARDVVRHKVNLCAAIWIGSLR